MELKLSALQTFYIFHEPIKNSLILDDLLWPQQMESHSLNSQSSKLQVLLNVLWVEHMIILFSNATPIILEMFNLI